MRGGKPILPRSADELLAHARQFKARTGKPYLIQSLVGDPAYQTRNLYTYLMAQDAVIFPDAKHVRLRTPEARQDREFLPPHQRRETDARSTRTRRRRSPPS